MMEPVAQQKSKAKGKQAKSGAVRAWLQAAGKCVLQAVPGFLLSFSGPLGMPPGMQTAYVLALAWCGSPLTGALLGCGAATVMRLVWGLGARLETLMCVVLGACLGSVIRGRGNGLLMLAAGAAMLPQTLWGLAAGTAQEAMLDVANLALVAVSAPVLLRAVMIGRGESDLDNLDAQVAAGYMLALMVCGSSRIVAFGVNLGMLGACFAACAMAIHGGVQAGMVTGLAGALALSLQGLPYALGISLTIGGFAAGMAQGMGKKWLGCLAFAAASALVTLGSGAAVMGCLAPCLLSPVLLVALRGKAGDRVAQACHRLCDAPDAEGDVYANLALSEWSKTMAEIARTVPQPQPDTGPREPAWWKAHLCVDCPDRENCDAALSDLAREKAESVWQRREADEQTWQSSLEELRGLGCGRLYCLRAGMEQLRNEEKIRAAWMKRAGFQREMLVTHLEAASGAAESFARIAGGDTWREKAVSRRLRQRMGETAYPASLLYFRKTRKRARACLEMRASLNDTLLEQACRLASEAFGAPMEVERVEEKRLYLMERPRLRARVGVFGQGAEEGSQTGDTAYTGPLPDGRFLAALSDGMGQGEQASKESGLTVRLLKMCMEAGYTRAQALCAVNGMMLLETGGERFATADLMTIDLQSGEAALDKLGAAGSWLLRGATLAEITGDALPIGIVETVESRSSLLKLRAGDRVALVTDGVEDAFDDREALERAIRSALEEPRPQTAAETLLNRARKAASPNRLDDMTVLAIYLDESTH